MKLSRFNFHLDHLASEQGKDLENFSQFLSLQRSTFFSNIRCPWTHKKKRGISFIIHDVSQLIPYQLTKKLSKQNQKKTLVTWSVFLFFSQHWAVAVPSHSWKPSYVSSQRDPGIVDRSDRSHASRATVDGNQKSGVPVTHQLRLGSFVPLLFTGFSTSQVVFCDFWTMNSISQVMQATFFAQLSI